MRRTVACDTAKRTSSTVRSGLLVDPAESRECVVEDLVTLLAAQGVDLWFVLDGAVCVDERICAPAATKILLSHDPATRSFDIVRVAP